LPLGFVCLGFVLFVVLLCACNGGYEPEVGGEDVIIPREYVDHELASVKVNIPRKITDDIDNGRRKEDYKVEWTPDAGDVGHVRVSETDRPSLTTTDNFADIVSTTFFIFDELDTGTTSTITISVYIRLPDSSGALARGKLVARRSIPTRS